MPDDPITRLNAALEGRYRIERQLGEGGMATVYLADDLRHERKVALKVLKPELAAVVGADRFLAEIKTTANLQHPHILPLFDSGEADSFLFYVMPYVEGESLRERLDREHQLPVDEAVQIAKNVAEALDYAHSHGVIHRDIKPANILLQAGKPVVSDFGIALALGAAGAGRLTETGLSLGTPHYMSPEQATGDLSVGAATDIYALGCVLYEMLVGEPPYTGSTPQAVLGKIISGSAPSAIAERKSVPPNVDAAIRRALEKVPADRFTGASAFGRTLSDAGFVHGSREAGAGAAFPGPTGPWNRLAVATTSLATVMTALFLWSILRPETPQPVSRQYLGTGGWAGLESQLGRLVAIAPDGSSMVVPVPTEGEGYQLGLKPRGTTEVTPIPGTEGAREVVFSPDGEWIAYAVGADVFKRPLVGGSPLRIADDAQPGSTLALTWLDDGTILYEQQTAMDGMSTLHLTRISEDGGEPLEVVFGVGEQQMSLIWAYGLPGARGALVIACATSGACPKDATQLYLVNLEDRSSEALFGQVLRAWYTRTGHLVYVQADGAVLAQPFDLNALELSGPAVPLFDGVATSAANVPSPFANAVLGPDGTLVYAEGIVGGSTGSRLVVVDREGNEEVLPLAPRLISWVSWSPDGASVAYDDNSQIYTYNVALGTTPRQITFSGANAFAIYSPDGKQLAFTASRVAESPASPAVLNTGASDVFVKNLDDDSPPRLVATLEGDQWLTQWESDSLILFEWGPHGESSSWDLGMLDFTDPGSPRADVYLSSEANLRDLLVSPDGRLAAYRSTESGRDEIYVRSFPNAGEQTLISQRGGTAPFWSPDGNTLYYARGNGGGSYSFFAARLQRDPVPAVLSTDSLFTGRYGQPFSGAGLHPDGDRWILSQPAAAAQTGGEESLRLVLVQNFFEELNRTAPTN